MLSCLGTDAEGHGNNPRIRLRRQSLYIFKEHLTVFILVRISDGVERNGVVQIKFFLFRHIVESTYLRQMVCNPAGYRLIMTGGADNCHFGPAVYAASVWPDMRAIDHHNTVCRSIFGIVGLGKVLQRKLSRRFHRLYHFILLQILFDKQSRQWRVCRHMK